MIKDGCWLLKRTLFSNNKIGWLLTRTLFSDINTRAICLVRNLNCLDITLDISIDGFWELEADQHLWLFFVALCENINICSKKLHELVFGC